MHNEQLCCKTGVLDFVKAVALAIVIMCCISIKHPIDKLKYCNTTGKLNWLRKRFTKKTFRFIKSCAIALCYWEKEQCRAHPGKLGKTIKPWWGYSLLSAQFTKPHRCQKNALGSDVRSRIQVIQKRRRPTNVMGQTLEWNAHGSGTTLKPTYFGLSYAISLDAAGHEKDNSEVVPWYLALGPWQWFILALWGLGGAAPLRPWLCCIPWMPGWNGIWEVALGILSCRSIHSWICDVLPWAGVLEA